MKILIFGSTGFVGKALSDFLETQNIELFRASSRDTSDTIGVDITNPDSFSKIDFKPDIIVNCASVIPQNGKTSKDTSFLKLLFDTNVIGGVNIANWAVANNVPKIINCSTLVVNGKPWPEKMNESYLSLPAGAHVGYCMSKLSQERLMNEVVAESNTHMIHLRLSAIYGTNMNPNGVIFQLLNKLKLNQDVELSDAETISFDFVHVDDVCKSIYTTAKVNCPAGVVNVASGSEISLVSLANMLKGLSGSTSRIISSINTGRIDKANIDVTKLKAIIGPTFNTFIPLITGLEGLVNRYKA